MCEFEALLCVFQYIDSFWLILMKLDDVVNLPPHGDGHVLPPPLVTHHVVVHVHAVPLGPHL